MEFNKVGRYLLKSELGRGGFATVYRAYDPVLEREVALKVLKPHGFPHDQTSIKRFKREAKAASSLEHPRIVPIYDFGEHEGWPYLVMKLMAGGSLRSALNNGPLTLDRTEKITSDVCSALDEVHRNGIIHRDLKPDNILFDSKGNAYLTDFGIAKLSTASASLTGEAILGTLPYMSPEQWKGGDIDQRVDVYALGILIFEMLSGKPPYIADTAPQFMHMHFNAPIPSISSRRKGIPRSCDQILKKSMAKKRESRYKTAGEIAQALRNAIHPTEIPIAQPAAYVNPRLSTVSAGRKIRSAIALVPRAGLNELNRVSRRFKQLAKTAFPNRPFSRLQKTLLIISFSLIPLLIFLYSFGPDIYHGNFMPAAGVELPQPVRVYTPAGTFGDMESSPSQTQASIIASPTTNQPATPVDSKTTLDNVEPTKMAIPSTATNWISDVDGMELVLVPEGVFSMGSPYEVGQGDEHPPHDVFLSSYRIDKTEVTNRMFSEFLNAVGNQKEEGTFWFNASASPRIEWSTFRSMIAIANGIWHPVEGYEDFPVVMVTWYGAKAYCEWTGRRLPTEAEWEKAARGSLSWTFPWGEEPPSCEKANFLPACNGGLLPVGTILEGASPYGVLDMAGNVAEWTSDWHLGYFSQDIPYLNPQGPDDGGKKVMKGGAWLSWQVWPLEDNGRSAVRSSWAPRSGNELLGFRCAMDFSD